jgi:hypothetical protein
METGPHQGYRPPKATEEDSSTPARIDTVEDAVEAETSLGYDKSECRKWSNATAAQRRKCVEPLGAMRQSFSD